MSSLDVRLKALEAEALTTEPASVERMASYYQSMGLEMPPINDLTTNEWLATVPTDTLRNILNDHTPEAHHAKP
ncbi:hypothetical protein B9Z45_03095 [Limnohabitans sp. 2KL-17]|uniref:hypothetical protein n=1 Tax=Limnohabitans sp. 2KL-17 TaxID=1100704 RepID=UPI000D38F751|nr:hypothetical protein [Limnohabitans sp. 2KL-17]PUE62579.1 hypothetical protein B9Z45_03095 [Limnohabitans sp. 2KL-17]